jgi:hypothetical protein
VKETPSCLQLMNITDEVLFNDDQTLDNWRLFGMCFDSVDGLES